MGRLCTMMLFLLLSIFVTSVIGIETIDMDNDTNLNITEGDYIIQSKKFPRARGDYSGGTVTINKPAEDGAGHYLFFTEFMFGELQYLNVTHDNVTDVLRGPVFPKRGSAAYIYTEGSVILTLENDFSDNNDDVIPHTGFQVIVKRHGANEIVGTVYSDTTDLDAMGYAYFFVSPAYPATNGSNVERTQTFTSNNSIRVLLYDFDFYGTVTLSGKDTNDTAVKLEYTGFQTNTSTVANYFLHEVTIDVKCEHSLGCGRYFVIVESYLPVPPTTVALNVTLLANETHSFNFQTYNDSGLAYLNNYNYYLNITAPDSTDQKIVLYLEYESEASCDGMSFTGLIANPENDNWRLTGAWYTYLFAETNNLQLTFTSDAVGRAAGFSGELYLQSCACPKDEVVDPDNYPTISVYHSCPGINCQWSYKFPVDQIFSFYLYSKFEFRNSDFLRISDRQNRTIVIYSNSNQVKNIFLIDSGIVHFHFVTSSDVTVPLNTSLSFEINESLDDATSYIPDENNIQQSIDQVTLINSNLIYSSYFNNITTVSPITFYDLSTTKSGFLSFYTNGSSYDVISPVINNGIASYSTDVSPVYVQYFNSFNDEAVIQLLADPSNVFTNVSCSQSSVVLVKQNASVVLNLEGQSGKCIFRLFHNATNITNSALTFSFDQLHDPAGVQIFSELGGPESVKLEHVPEYIFGQWTTVQYSGSPGTIVVRSVPMSTHIVLESNCTPTYVLMPEFKNGRDIYYISALNNETNWAFHLTVLNHMDEYEDFLINVWNGDTSNQEYVVGDDMKVNKTMVFVGTNLSIKAVNVTVPRLYFSVAYCKVKPGSAKGIAGNIFVLCMTIWTALWNYYNFS